jgi:hypothetical protein
MADQTTTQASTLSAWAGPYVTNMLGKTQAVANLPYAMYGGALTAGPSQLQNQAFSGVAGLTLPDSVTDYNPMQYSSGLPGTSATNPFGVGDTQSYMNPYLQGVLDPQLREARRQADITRVNNAGRLTQQGAFGGARQAILEAEGDRNLGQLQSDITGKGYANAWDKALEQQMGTAKLGLAAQEGTDRSRQFGANLGMDQGKFGIASLDQMMKAGEQQRGIEQQGLSADYAEFARQRDYPQEMLKFQQSMLQGLPIDARTTTTPGQSSTQSIVGGIADLAAVLKAFNL